MHQKNYETALTYLIDLINARIGTEGFRWCISQQSILLGFANYDEYIQMPLLIHGYNPVELTKKEELELANIKVDETIREIIGFSEIPILANKLTYDAHKCCKLKFNNDHVVINYDLLGTVFYILTRAEEYRSSIRDAHGRFPAKASHAYKHGYLQRPVVDEHIEILWHCMSYLWPRLQRKKGSYQLRVSHDVDFPFELLFRPQLNCLFSLFKNAIVTRKIDFSRFRDFYDVRYCNLIEKDPFYVFDCLMDVSEANSVKSTFYFIAGKSSSYDGYYDLNHPLLLEIMQNIHKRGHRIGYHGSYETYLDSQATINEVKSMRKILSQLGVEQDCLGGRQHYLRWSVPQTWRNYEQAGLSYDATLSYADYAGFRCGTCHAFPVFDLHECRELKLIEYPLTAMECSLLDKPYMNLTCGQAYDYVKTLVDACRKHNGCFSLLWHNSRFVEAEEILLYEEILKL